MEDAALSEAIFEELSVEELTSVSGGGLTEWGVGIGTAVAFVGMAAGAMAAAPVLAGVFAGASILSSGMSIYYYRR